MKSGTDEPPEYEFRTDEVSSGEVTDGDAFDLAVESLVPEPTIESPKNHSVITRSQWVVKGGLWFADALAVVCGLAAASAITATWEPVPGLVFLAVGGLWAGSRRLYRARALTRRVDEARRVVEAVAMTAATTVVIAFLIDIELDRWWLVFAALFAWVGVSSVRELHRQRFTALRRQGKMLRRAVLVGINDEASEFAEMILADATLGYSIEAAVDPDTVDTPQKLTTHVLRIAREADASTVVIASSAVDMRNLNRLIRDLVEAGLHVDLSSSLADIAPSRLTMRPLGRFPVLYVEPVNRHGWRARAKRTFDIFVSGAVLTLMSPLMIATALAIKISSSGPVLFRQVRVGQEGTPFRVLKFRTMVVDAEAQLGMLSGQNEAAGPLFKMKNDPRITRVGSVLRRTSIDELPQLINVVRGQMSLVGPRPALPSEMAGWDGDLYARLRVKPGITGMWQVSGRSATTFDEYTRLDLYYVDNWSLLIDVGILAKTIPAVLKSSGAY